MLCDNKIFNKNLLSTLHSIFAYNCSTICTHGYKEEDKYLGDLENEILFLFDKCDCDIDERYEEIFLETAYVNNMIKLTQHLVTNIENAHIWCFNDVIRKCSFEMITMLYTFYKNEVNFEINKKYMEIAKENKDERVYQWALNEFRHNDPIFILHEEFKCKYMKMMKRLE